MTTKRRELAAQGLSELRFDVLQGALAEHEEAEQLSVGLPGA
jgi:hypothetical protein